MFWFLFVFVFRVVDYRRVLFVFVFRVGFFRMSLFVVIRNFGVCWVGYYWSFLVIVFFDVLVFGDDGFFVFDLGRFVVELVIRFDGVYVWNYRWSVFVLVCWFFCFGIWNFVFIDLIFGFFVIGIVNFFGWVEWWFKVFE